MLRLFFTLLILMLSVYYLYLFLKKRFSSDDITSPLSSEEREEVIDILRNTQEGIRETLPDLKLIDPIIYRKTLELHDFSSRILDYYSENPDALGESTKRLWKNHIQSILVLLNKYCAVQMNSGISLQDNFQERILNLIDKMLRILERTRQEMHSRKTENLNSEIEALRKEMEMDGF
ncbi:MAG: hypothetical protein H7A24_16075 [Leptospiraceae bacterium]|nr:hypothetical protein [Leptospiraceae bacterium]MCP5513405.1 hypothetical protein [Leptospiraceae bacterium]